MIGPGKGVRPQEGCNKMGMGTIHGAVQRLDALILGNNTDQNPDMEKKVGMPGVTENPSAT
jgi:hypothetical protein